MAHRRRLLLPPPRVLFSNNHLLAVDKPPGWSSIPTKEYRNKSLLHHLKRQELGGGSQNDFLVPLHRIDQPCSGVLLFAKTSKAAKRITAAWKKQLVQKTYICRCSNLLLQHNSTRLEEQDEDTNNGDWWILEGWMKKQPGQRSVTMFSSPEPDSRHCRLLWRRVMLDDDDDDDDDNSKNNNQRFLEVRTDMGARHMIRALVSRIGHSPIDGDLRYGAAHALPDKSVALHAHTVTLPPSLQLGDLTQRHFSSPIPDTWRSYFHTHHQQLQERLSTRAPHKF